MEHESIGIDRRAAIAAIGTLGAAAAGAMGLQPQPTRPGRPQQIPIGRPPQGQLPPLAQAQLGWDPQKGEYVLPPLPYPAEALEPHIDAQTMTLHHDKHHAAYVQGLNRAIKELTALREGNGDAGLTRHWLRELAFHGSGHVNHTLFWHTMAPPAKQGEDGRGGGGEPQGLLAQAIQRDFGGFDAFASQFKSAASGVEGGGWAWLVHEPIAGRLLIVQVEKQQDHMFTGMIPLLGVDVWEHAYYLKYQNNRSAYIDAFMKVINWPRVEQLHAAAAQRREDA